MNYQDLSIKLIQEQYKLKNSKSKSILVRTYAKSIKFCESG